MSHWKEDLRPLFKALDHDALLGRFEERDPGRPLDDFARLAFGFALLADGRREEADELLGGVGGDGSASLGDLAYVRAFRRELDGDVEGMIQVLSAHLNDEGATHGARMRLRVADGLVRLQRFEKVAEILDPLLQPPGVPETLEAYFIILEGMLQFGSAKEKIIEHVSVIDGLIERGFRLREAGNAVYYAALCQEKRIEPLVGPLLKVHERALEGFSTERTEEIRFLLSAGDRFKVPAAVRAAARSYVEHPFPWSGEFDPDKVAYLFSTHEEHAAAREAILQSFPPSRRKKDSAVWGPLILAGYHAGQWKETLALLREHRADIARLPMAAHCGVVRVVCEYQLGRFAEALRSFEESRESFLRSAQGYEAATVIFLLAALGRRGEIPDAMAEILAVRAKDGEFTQDYFQATLLQLIMRGDVEAFRRWAGAIHQYLSSDAARGETFQDIGLMALDWGVPVIAGDAARHLEDAGHPSKASLLRAGIAARESADGAAMERQFEAALAAAAPRDLPLIHLQRARWRRFLGNLPGALEDLDRVLTVEDFPFRHRALALRGAILEARGGGAEELEALEKEAGAWLTRHARSREEYEQLHAEGRSWYQGDTAAVLAGLLAHRRKDMPGNPEVLRLALLLESAPDAAEEQRTAARAARREWERKHLLPPWPKG